MVQAYWDNPNQKKDTEPSVKPLHAVTVWNTGRSRRIQKENIKKFQSLKP
jgi:hypothetical protein